MEVMVGAGRDGSCDFVRPLYTLSFFFPSAGSITVVLPGKEEENNIHLNFT